MLILAQEIAGFWKLIGAFRVNWQELSYHGCRLAVLRFKLFMGKTEMESADGTLHQLWLDNSLLIA
jgi:hypothetical protein